MLLGGARGGYGALICAVNPECSSGLQSGGCSPLCRQDVGGDVGSVLGYLSSFYTRVQAESVITPILMQLREVLFLWEILDPRANPSGEGMREGPLARTYRPPRCLD